jgi:hypothetical protein
VRISLKNQLILITDEVHAAVARTAEEKKSHTKNRKWGQKRKAQEVQSESEDNLSQIGSD